MNKHAYLARLQDELQQRDVAASEIEAAVEFYDEAISDRMEQGADEHDAVAEMESAELAAQAIVEDIPPVRRAAMRLGATHERRALATVLIVLGAPVWISLLIAGVLSALAVYVSIWSIIASLWITVVSLAVSGIASIPYLVYAAGNGAAATGMFCSGLRLVLAGVGVALVPAVMSATKGLVWLSRRFVRWITHFFVRAANGEGLTREQDSTPATAEEHREHRRRAYGIVGGSIALVGAALVLVALVLCGFDLRSLPAPPPIATPFGDIYFTAFGLLH